MSENDFIEDNIDRILYYQSPTTGNSFEGLWVLSALFTKWRKDRKAKKKELREVEESEQLIVRPERKSETISI